MVPTVNAAGAAKASGASDWANAATQALSESGHRAGGARSAVLDLLSRQSCCLSAHEIATRLGRSGKVVGRASVYRALDLLHEMALVQRVDLGDGEARYEPIQPDGEHHHHLVCDDCGKVEAFADEELERVLRQVEGRTGYSVAGHDVVLRGACDVCAPAGRTP